MIQDAMSSGEEFILQGRINRSQDAQTEEKAVRVGYYHGHCHLPWARNVFVKIQGFGTPGQPVTDRAMEQLQKIPSFMLQIITFVNDLNCDN